MATIYLVRHAAHDLLDHVLTGRMPRVHLGDPGREQARRLALHFRPLEVTAVQSSPRERAVETARPIAEAAGLACQETAALDEIHTGEWTGQSFAVLAADERWQVWNARRSSASAPGGESMAEVQDRVVRHMRMCGVSQPDARLVMVSHADVIKAALLYILGASLDAYDRLEIAPASISTVVLGEWGAKVVGINAQAIAA
ncbi:MAG TPA: histidine phosphatase family protein [Ferrovibrio sp.]|uniref:histidine phosphatase family protein n=1 Tax=Ferrovibrio sp. TaxID=1917215 RepID=UPI002ED274CB